MKTFGCIKSEENPNDIIFKGLSNLDFYKRDLLTSIKDQGSKGSCVAQSIYELYAFYKKFKNQDLDISPTYSFDRRKDKSINGMRPREAFEILKQDNKIESYAKINDLTSLKNSIIVNGGALIALNAKSDDPDFWKGSSNLGGHAVCAYGFDKDFIYFKNSWGTDWANFGCWKLPITDFNKIIEAWTILT